MTGVSSMCSTACGCQKLSGRKAATTVWARRWSAQFEESGSPTRNHRIGQEERGCSLKRKARLRWGWMLSQKGLGLGVETGSLLHLGGDQGAPKGTKWVFEEDSPKFRWGLRSQ